VQAARELGVSRVALYRAVSGRHVPRDRTLLPRYYELMRSKDISPRGGFILWPGVIFRAGDDDFMRTIAATYPAAVRFVSGGLEVLAPIAFTVTNQTPIPAACFRGAGAEARGKRNDPPRPSSAAGKVASDRGDGDALAAGGTP
jgi:hypothetical protein